MPVTIADGNASAVVAEFNRRAAHVKELGVEAKKLLKEASAARATQNSDKRSAAVVPSVKLAKIEGVEYFTEYERQEIEKALMSLKAYVETQQKKRERAGESVDAVLTTRIKNIDEILDLVKGEKFQPFAKKWRQLSHTFPEHRVKFLVSRRSAADKGRITVVEIEKHITQIVTPIARKEMFPPEMVKEFNQQFGTLKTEIKSTPQIFKPLVLVYTTNSGKTTLAEDKFLSAVQMKLAIYLKHLEKSKAQPGDMVLQDKKRVIEALLVKARARDMAGFEQEWLMHSATIEMHRPKSFMGHKIKFTSVLPFEGKTLVNDINKMKNELRNVAPAMKK
jgi:hypothetical protein